MQPDHARRASRHPSQLTSAVVKVPTAHGRVLQLRSEIYPRKKIDIAITQDFKPTCTFVVRRSFVLSLVIVMLLQKS
ncbi:hypothetical protein BDW71DRAFT_188822 [Aspergillus fruticulosus]